MPEQSLAVKYRPTTFDDVSEQDSIKKILTQQLETSTIKNAYLFCGGAGTGKTSCGRIFANEINHGKGAPLELDAASYNSVDDVRNITQQARTQSLDSEYKTIIIDECVTGDVEVLTTEGFKRFDECDGTEIVAQYNKGNIEFVPPDSWVKQSYVGDLVKWSPRNWCSIRMTPHHVQPLYYPKSGIKEAYIKDVKFHNGNKLIVAGKGTGVKCELTPIDRLAIACQADATIQSLNNGYTHWSIKLTKQRKIDRLLKIFADGNIEYSEISCNGQSRRFTFNTTSKITKYLSTYFNIGDFNNCGARQFIEEVVAWDGYSTDRYVEYVSTEQSNADFVASIAVLGGYSVRQRVQNDNRQAQYKDVHKVFMYDDMFCGCQSVGKTLTFEAYEGLVYCVRVPSHQIVIRSQGFVFITGNCHSLSNNAWQAFLKTLEEPPKKTIFIFCTTNPEKIPNTILSRVQRYDFKRISQKGILDRLNWILQKERIENFSTDAINYISKIADGGMRDAITLLDKCLAYSEELTLENVVKALGTVDYQTMFDLTEAICVEDSARVLQIIEGVHSEGKDLKQFIRGYMSFLLDICKYDITKTFEYLQIPQTYSEQMQSMPFSKCQTLLDVVVKLNANIKWDSQPKVLIEAILLRGV